MRVSAATGLAASSSGLMQADDGIPTPARLWTVPHMQVAVRVHARVVLPLGVSDHHFSRIGKGNAAIVTAILLDANRKQASIVSLLPLVHAGIQPTHGRILEINEVAFVHV